MQVTNNTPVRSPAADLLGLAFEEILDVHPWGQYDNFKISIDMKSNYINASHDICPLVTTGIRKDIANGLKMNQQQGYSK
jgi:hypothetical protein